MSRLEVDPEPFLRASVLVRAQVIDLAGMSPINMLQHVRREDAQSEWQHNMDYCPETLNKVGVPCICSHACACPIRQDCSAPCAASCCAFPNTCSFAGLNFLACRLFTPRLMLTPTLRLLVSNLLGSVLGHDSASTITCCNLLVGGSG